MGGSVELVIITGLSGAGKSTAASYMEDMGFYCIDNLPPQLLPALLEAIHHQDQTEQKNERYALVMDVRAAARFGGLTPFLTDLLRKEIRTRILFLEASDEVLLSRYKQSRRNHPLAEGGALLDSIRIERQRLAPVRELASDIVDTGHMSGRQLREELFHIFQTENRKKLLQIYIQSFGFKYGIPLDLDLLLDVRFVPNPFYQPELRPLCGLDQEIVDFIWAYPETEEILTQYLRFITSSLPFYQREGKVRLNIGVGCTGGRHRSVAMARVLKERLEGLEYPIYLDHRDIQRDPQGGL